jgi:hypothetical protein
VNWVVQAMQLSCKPKQLVSKGSILLTSAPGTEYGFMSHALYHAEPKANPYTSIWH